MARKIVAEFDAIDGPFLNKLRAIDRSIGRFETGAITSIGRVEKGIGGLLNSATQFRNVTGLIASGLGVNLATGFVDQAARIRNSLTQAGDGSEEAFQRVYLAASRSLAGFETFASGVQHVQKAMGDKQTFNETVRQMETLNKLMATGGKTTQERMSTMIQFSQAIQSGILGGEELRSLRENAPLELVRAIAREAGGTIEDLKDFGAQGKLTTDVMIRALNSLEAQADASFANIRLTIQDAATVFANGALVATEGFDKGLGLSRAAVTGLKSLGDLLGTNAGAFEIFGKAAKFAGIAFAVSFAGRQLNESITAMRQMPAVLRETVVAAEREYAVATRSVTKRAEAVAVIKRQIDALAMQVGTASKLEKANIRLSGATDRLRAALANQALAANAANAAQERLQLSSRLAAGAGNLMRSAWAFLGGWPGLILAAGTAFLTLSSNAESAAERFDRLTSGTGEAEAAADSLREVQSRLNDAVEESGLLSDTSARKIIANTREEMVAKRELLALENQRLQALQAERQVELSRLKSEQRAIDSPASRVDEILQAQLGEQAAFAAAEDRAAALAQATREFNAEFAAVNNQIVELNSNITLTGGVISSNNALLAESDALTQATAQSVLAMVPGYQSLQDAALGFASRLAEAWGNAEGVASTDMASGVAAAAAEAQGLAGWLAQAYGRAMAIAQQAATANAWIESNQKGGAGYLANQYALYGAGRQAFDNAAREQRTLYNPPAVVRGGSGVGSSGGSAAKEEKADQADALRFIESMMTAEEKRAKEISEMIKLRERLAETYGPEVELVTQLDAAIAKATDGMEGLNGAKEKFFETLSDEIASSIEDWKGWGNFVRSVLASLIQANGVDFFTALLTPGGQKGGGLGTILGNMLTGNKSSNVSRSANISRNAAGNVAIPTMGGQSSSVQVVQHNDFRGVDPSMKEFILGQLSQRDREMPARVLDAVRKAKSGRML